MSAPFTAAVGPAEEFYTGNVGLGYNEAPVGGTFIKIGVGVLRKPQAPRYDHSSRTDRRQANGRSRRRRRPSSSPTICVPVIGLCVQLRKVVRLTPGNPEMTIAHRLRNTGTKAIATNVYNHDFVVLDRQPPGPDFVVKFPYPLVPGARGRAPRRPAPHLARRSGGGSRAVARPRRTLVDHNVDASCRSENSCAPVGELVGNEIRYTKVLEGQERMTTGVGGFSNEVKDYDIRVENAKVGVGFRLTADTPRRASRTGRFER